MKQLTQAKSESTCLIGESTSTNTGTRIAGHADWGCHATTYNDGDYRDRTTMSNKCSAAFETCSPADIVAKVSTMRAAHYRKSLIVFSRCLTDSEPDVYVAVILHCIIAFGTVRITQL